LDIHGLISKIIISVSNIDSGRKGFAIRGKEQEGRISYEDGISEAIAVKKDSYQVADDIFPHDKKYRVKGFPKDSFHIACASHQTRIRNILSSPGIDLIEKTLLKQRFANMITAKNSYLEKQKESLRKKKEVK